MKPVPADSTPEALDRWLQGLRALGNPFEEPGEWEAFQATLAEADRLAKEWVRREMGLP